MNVRELIAALQKCPPDMDACVWDESSDDWIPVTMALHEDGVSDIHLLTQDPPPVVHPVHTYGSCGAVCGLCGDEPDPSAVSELTRLREALQWYADDGTHAPPGHSAEGWCRDSGHRARLALGLPSKDE